MVLFLEEEGEVIGGRWLRRFSEGIFIWGWMVFFLFGVVSERFLIGCHLRVGKISVILEEEVDEVGKVERGDE